MKDKHEIFVGKDLDFLEKEDIVMDAETKADIIETIRKDVNFLKMVKMMDYSLLLVISKAKNEELSPAF